MHDLLAYAIVIAIEPLPIIGFILVLSTDGGTRNGFGFLVGWVSCLVALIAATVLLTGGTPPSRGSTTSTASEIAMVVLGVALLGYAYWRARVRPPPERPPPSPSWTNRLDGMGPGGAAALGILLQPWPIVVAAAAGVMKLDISHLEAVIELVAFCLVATSALLSMQIYSIVAHDAARERLEALRTWLDNHRERAITFLAAIVGLYLAVQGVVGLLH